MRIVDFYLKIFNKLQDKKGANNLVTPRLRGLIKRIGDKHIPYYLDKHSSRNSKRLGELVVSLTSYPARIDTAWRVIECLKRQTVCPNKIILWLSKEQFPVKNMIPSSLLSRQDETFEIRLVDGDLRSHKKYYYVFREYVNSKIVLIDDDIYYPSNMLEEMVAASLQYPRAVISRYGYNIRYDSNGNIKPYREWSSELDGGKFPNFFYGSGGGTLIVPKLLYKDCLRKDLFWSLTPFADDIWLNAMTRLAGLPIVKLPAGLIWSFSPQKNSLSEINLDGNQNDKQLHNITQFYKSQIGRDPFCECAM